MRKFSFFFAKLLEIFSGFLCNIVKIDGRVTYMLQALTTLYSTSHVPDSAEKQQWGCDVVDSWWGEMFILMKCQLRNTSHDENFVKDNGKICKEALITIGVTCLFAKASLSTGVIDAIMDCTLTYV